MNRFCITQEVAAAKHLVSMAMPMAMWEVQAPLHGRHPLLARAPCATCPLTRYSTTASQLNLNLQFGLAEKAMMQYSTSQSYTPEGMHYARESPPGI